MTRRGWLLFALISVIWGIPYLLIKVAVRDFSPAGLVFARTGLGAVLLVPLVVRGGALRGLWAHRWPLLAYTVIEIAVPWVLLSDAERKVASSLAGLLVAGVPIAAIGLIRILDRRRAAADPLDRWRVAGLVTGIVGVAVLLGFDRVAPQQWPVVELGIVIVCYAAGPIIAGRWLADAPNLGVAMVSLALCAVGYAPFAIPSLPHRLPGWPVLLSVLVLGAICTAAAFPLFFALISEVGPTRATVVTFVNPAVAVLLGVTVLGEPLRVATGIGFVLILGGSVLATRSVLGRRSPAGRAVPGGDPGSATASRRSGPSRPVL